MNHSIIAEGFGIRHRPVRMEDAPFLVWLRNLEHAKGKVGDSAMNVCEQEDWLRTYFQREGDYYFIGETTHRIPVVTFGIYNVISSCAEIGRLICRPNVPAVVPGLIPSFDIAFVQLGLREITTKVVSTNQVVVRMDQHLGFQITHIEHAAQVIGGKSVDLIHMKMKAEDWPKMQKKIAPMALRMQGQLRAWEQSVLSESNTYLTDHATLDRH